MVAAAQLWKNERILKKATNCDSVRKRHAICHNLYSFPCWMHNFLDRSFLKFTN
jgi:hypothetical protein